jgi:hypothetical protein
MMARQWLANLCDDMPEMAADGCASVPGAGPGRGDTRAIRRWRCESAMPAIARFFPMQYTLLQLPRQ